MSATSSSIFSYSNSDYAEQLKKLRKDLMGNAKTISKVIFYGPPTTTNGWTQRRKNEHVNQKIDEMKQGFQWEEKARARSFWSVTKWILQFCGHANRRSIWLCPTTDDSRLMVTELQWSLGSDGCAGGIQRISIIFTWFVDLKRDTM